MVLDYLINSQYYYKLHPNIKTVLEIMQSEDFTDVPIGKVAGLGNNDDWYITVLEYDTKRAEENHWETHKKYIDIQYIISGIERMDYSQDKDLTILQPYEEEKDRTFFSGEGQSIIVPSGYFTIFFPHDAHRCCCFMDSPKKVRKILGKIRID